VPPERVKREEDSRSWSLAVDQEVLVPYSREWLAREAETRHSLELVNFEKTGNFSASRRVSTYL
jgi:hypothetical protein